MRKSACEKQAFFVSDAVFFSFNYSFISFFRTFVLETIINDYEKNSDTVVGCCCHVGDWLW
jgi:hypothetical protein